MAITNDQFLQGLYIAYWGRPADPEGFYYWKGKQAELGFAGIAENFAASAEGQATYPYFKAFYTFGAGAITETMRGDFVEQIYQNLFNRAADAEGKAYWIAQLTSGASTPGAFIANIVNAAVVGAGDDFDTLLNKAVAAEDFTALLVETGLEWNTTLSTAVAGIIADVDGDSDMDAIGDAIEAAVGGGSIIGGTLTLTQQADVLTGDSNDNVFVAPVTQNTTGSGQLANTFETGDVLNGAGGRNILRADLIETGTIQDGVNEAPISATTANIQEVYLRAQRAGVAQNTIDAEKMSGVEQWWSENSRSGIIIEDIRTLPASTAFGMRLTDPTVGFANYFNALFLEGDTNRDSALTLLIQEITNGQDPAATELENITVREINFSLNGVDYSLDTEAMRAADTWADLETAITAAMAATSGLSNLSVTHVGNGVFVIEDAAGGIFEIADGEALILGNAAGIDVRNRADVGLVIEEGPTMTDVFLDGAGNGSQGGTLNIGAMSGLRGIEVFDVFVDRDSHLTSMTSFNQTPGQYVALRNGEANEFLQVVNVTSIGANGDLEVGRTTANLDGRVATWSNAAGIVNGVADSGFVNIQELDAANFTGSLNLAITLDNNVIQRYLDDATESVTFSYTGSAQNDIFNIADVSTLGVSGDQDFAMTVGMGAGDDRLILSVPTVRAVSVDGGTGENSIVVTQSHGTTAANTFKTFANFQTYEVEGTGNNVVNNTVHNFTSMSGVKNVIIATDGNTVVGGIPTVGDNTQLINLEAAQNVTVSGKNQTIGNNSTRDQIFGTVTLTNDKGVDRTITLDNTARLANSVNGVRQDGVLTVNNLTINTNPVNNAGTTHNVTIVSDGERTVANAIAQFNGRDVRTLKLTGEKDLTINVAQIADQASVAGVNTATSVQINAADLKGSLKLALNGTMLNNFGSTPPTPAQIDTLTGTTGTNDTVMFYGALTAGNAVTATAIERVQLGTYGGDGVAGGASTGIAVDEQGVLIVDNPLTVADESINENTMYGDLAIADTGASGILNTANLGTSTFDIAAITNAQTLGLTNMAGGSIVNLGDVTRNSDGNRVVSQLLNEQINLQSSALTAATTASTITINRTNVIASGTATEINIGDSVAGATANTGNFRTINLDVARDVSLGALVSDNNIIDLDVGSQARTLNITGGVAGRSNQAADAAEGEVQLLDFAGLVVTGAGAGNITVGGVAVALANGDTAAITAGKVAVALNAVVAGTAIGDATFTAVGSKVFADFTQGYDNIAANQLAVADAGAAFVGGVTAAATARVVDNVYANRAATLQVADVIDLTDGGTNFLTNNLETINLANYNGQVTLAMTAGNLGVGQTDVNFTMSAYNANITLNNGGGVLANIAHNSVFDFDNAGTTTLPSQWTIANIVYDGAVAGTVNNNTLFDLRGLGMTDYAKIDILYVNDGDVYNDLYGNTLAAGTAVIRSEAQSNVNANTWEIVVTSADGVALTGTVATSAITEANFIF